jgi:type II secretory pathway component GspD/PulD (secretin)
MSTLSLILAGSLAFADGPNAPGETPFDRLTFNGCTVNEGCARLAALSGLSVSVSAKASNSLLILNISNIKASAALEAMVKAAGLAWRRDEKTGVYHVMTVEEYRAGLQLTDSPEIRSFKVNPANMGTIAQTIGDLYGERVQLNFGSKPRDFSQESVEVIGGEDDEDSEDSSNGSSNNRNGSNSRNGSSSNRNGGTSRNSSSFSNSVVQQQPAPLPATALNTESAANLERARQGGIAPLSASQLAGTLTPIYLSLVQEHSLVLIRSADPKVLDDVAKLVERLDKPVPQVLLEMKILKLRLRDGMSSSFDYEIAGGSVETTTPSGLNLNPLNPAATTGRQNLGGAGKDGTFSPTFVYQYLDDNLRARIKLLASDDRVETLATPLLVATNNRSARIVVAEEKVITTGATTQTITNQTGVANQTVAFDTEVRDVGTTLRLIPYINDDDTVTLYIEQDNSTVNLQGNTILVSDPVLGTTEVKVDSVETAQVLATVNAKNNFAVAVGGLIRNENSRKVEKVPWLGDIPYLGWFFRSEENVNEKTELVLIITPRIIRSGEEGQAITQARAAELSTHGWHSFGQAGTDAQNGRIAKYKEEIKEIQKKLKDEEEKAVKPDAAP